MIAMRLTLCLRSMVVVSKSPVLGIDVGSAL